MKLASSLICGGLAAQTLVTTAFADDQPLYKDRNALLEPRVTDLCGRLTQDEKLALLGGTGFTTQPIPRLGVPAMAMADAGQGVRGGPDATLGPATAFPSGVAMAATWDPAMVARIGQAIAEEARNKGTGVQILLGPAVNIHRSPLGGRNGEYFSEDPFLAARLATAYIRGVQGAGVAACIKHFACNNEEVDRDSVNVHVDERTLREIYLPAFEAGVKEGHVWALMSSYNCVSGFHSSANPHLLTEILKRQWGFDGVVMSDWGGVHETAVVQAGNDLEMPTGNNMSVTKLKAALARGTVTQAAVDDSVRRIVRTIVRVGLLDGLPAPDAAQVNSAAHSRVAYDAATEGIVLLKNDRALLPLDPARIHSLAVIGPDAKKLQVGALGSPEVKPAHIVQVLDGITHRAARDGVKVTYAVAMPDAILVPGAVIRSSGADVEHGFRAEYFKNRNLEGQPALVRMEDTINLGQADTPAPGIPHNNFSVRWTGKLVVPQAGDYHFTFTGDDGFRVFLDGQNVADRWQEQAATPVNFTAALQAGRSYDLRIEYFQAGGDYQAQFVWQVPGPDQFAEAVAAAKNADAAVVCVSTRHTEGEGSDRPAMDLPDDQQVALIKAVAGANPNTIVILNNGTPVALQDWLGGVAALVEGWFPGQEGGDAIAAVLFGDVNPSGKLPDTFAASRRDYPDFGNFPGQQNQVNYAEGIYVGYRHFDKKGVAPVFPFGYGLGYTTFEYSHLALSQPKLSPEGSLTVTVQIANTGKRAGTEIAQLYVRDLQPQIDKPVRELKGFMRVPLEAGASRTATFTLKPRDLAYFNVAAHAWRADAGRYAVEIGASSRDLRQTAEFTLDSPFTEPVQ